MRVCQESQNKIEKYTKLRDPRFKRVGLFYREKRVLKMTERRVLKEVFKHSAILKKNKNLIVSTGCSVTDHQCQQNRLFLSAYFPETA